MNPDQQRAVDILRELGSRPAVPFHEEGPARYILQVLAEIGLDARRDAFGNVVAHYRRPESGPTGGEPPIAFVAHMDHPGFETVDGPQGRTLARALGGVPVASLTKPTPVVLLEPGGGRLRGRTTPLDEGQPADGAERLVSVELESGVAPEPPAPVVFDLPDFVLDGDIVRMRALDDLAGCAGILAALERLVSEEAETDVYGVFTRAEEGGLFGARLMAEADTLPAETLIVSVESSPVIPGVAQGGGPVIRTGDAAYTFDADAEQVLIAAREAIREREPDFACQRQLMSGGTCEATAFAVQGYRATGLAFPLGNYHNATTSIPDPDGGVGAEYVALSDFLGGVELIAEAAKSVARRKASPVRRRLAQVPDDVRRRLESSAGG